MSNQDIYKLDVVKLDVVKYFMILVVSEHKAKELKDWLIQQSDTSTPPQDANVIMDVEFKTNLDLVRTEKHFDTV